MLPHFKRVAILDVDTHHGDGTQSIFYRRGEVQFVSIHVDPTNYYPFFSGYADEYGAGEGEGANLNIPLQPGSGDADFLDALDDALEAIRAHRSEALLVSVGFDAHERDPLSVLKVTNDGYRRIGDAVAGAEAAHRAGPGGRLQPRPARRERGRVSSAASTSRAGCRSASRPHTAILAPARSTERCRAHVRERLAPPFFGALKRGCC